MCRAVRRQLGRRGTALALLGAGKVLYGLGYLLAGEDHPPGLELLTRHGDIRAWALVWIICGTATFVCAFLRIGRDWAGFLAALFPPFVWGGAYAWAALAYDYPRGWTVAGWFAVSHCAVILWAASVPEHSIPHPKRRGDPT
ncbi:hypothetical protein [Streptomyces sp. NPDC102370]|uniref:hypothetical protein n=1 Tax=Streptomyces sp. NPDC102370 TaxID=3366163 RepID=UPI003825707E